MMAVPTNAGSSLEFTLPLIIFCMWRRRWGRRHVDAVTDVFIDTVIVNVK
jgi:hypothetical protein